MSATIHNTLPDADENTPLLDPGSSLVSPTPSTIILTKSPEDRASHGSLRRGLSTRQVQMIAIAGTIGTGLFLGTGRSLAQGGPASMLICYTIVGAIVYVTLLLLGEMATQYPVAGSFNAYATRFFSPSYGFALSWNYWFNDAMSVASDLTAAQLVLDFWSVPNAWVASVSLWIFLVGVNAAHVKAYGEMEYWLSFLKVVTVVVFVIIGILVNMGVNREHHFIGTTYWKLPGAPFVGGFGGFAHVFVTASFAYGGTESLGITAGETKNPTKNMPKVVKAVFWRILLFYVLSILLIGLDVPYTYPNLSNKTTTTSPFTIVFTSVGSNVAGSFMNAVILTSVISAGNHALFAGTRVLYGLATTAQAPVVLGWTTSSGVPLPALLVTASISALCFGSSFIGSGQLWAWLQNLVGVSNQIAWLSIGIASWRFRKAWVRQRRPLSEMKFRASWTWPWGPPFVIVTVAALLLIQGWSSFIPVFSPVDFVSYYIELPVMFIMYVAWAMAHSPGKPARTESPSVIESRRRRFTIAERLFDIVDTDSVDLRRDEYETMPEDSEEDAEREANLKGRSRWLWRAYYLLA